MKLPRTVRLDPSDDFVFAPAAGPGEWAVSGAFMFADADPEALGPKERAALRAGFLGIASFGWSTLVAVEEIDAPSREAVAAALAREIHDRFGAPDMAAARAAAEEELAFAAALCDHPPGTLIAVHREVDGEGALRERFRTLHRREPLPGADRLHAHARAFTVVEFDEDEADGPAERVDIAGLAAPGS